VCVDEFVIGFDEVLSDPALADEIVHRNKQEGFVRCTMIGDLRIPVSGPVGAKLPEHLEVFVNHLSE
jgi:hypothetical protein